MYKTTSTDVLTRFDFVKLSSNGVCRMTTSTDNLDNWGITLDSSVSGADEAVRVVIPTGYNQGVVFEYDMETATAVTAGENLAFGTLQKLVNTDTDPIMVCVQNNSCSSATTVKCVMKLKIKTNASFLADAS